MEVEKVGQTFSSSPCGKFKMASTSSGGNGHGGKGENSLRKNMYPSKKDGKPGTGKVSLMGIFGFKCVQVVDRRKKSARIAFVFVGIS